MRFLIVGDFVWEQYQEACARSLESLGHTVDRFSWASRFWDTGTDGLPRFKGPALQLQYHMARGPALARLRRRLLNVVLSTKYDVIWFYNAALIDGSTVQEVRKVAPSAILCGYLTDYVFRSSSRPNAWSSHVATLSYMDIQFAAMRPGEVQAFKQAGSQRVEPLQFYYVQDLHYPEAPNAGVTELTSDVVFVGHFEHDGRLELLELMSEAGLNVKVYGPGWRKPLARSSSAPLRNQASICRPVFGQEYRQVVAQSEISLCFLSKINQDSYTSRNFELPAMKAVVLSEFSTDLAKLFDADEEILLFREPYEAVLMARELARIPDARKQIAESAFRRVLNDSHDVDSRMQRLVDTIQR